MISHFNYLNLFNLELFNLQVAQIIMDLSCLLSKSNKTCTFMFNIFIENV